MATSIPIRIERYFIIAEMGFYGVSSGKTGRVKRVSKEYIAREDDKAKIIK